VELQDAKMQKKELGMVVHEYNPNYLGGRRIMGLREARAKVVGRLYLKDKTKTKGLGM
jgi:hypothetical protein